MYVHFKWNSFFVLFERIFTVLSVYRTSPRFPIFTIILWWISCWNAIYLKYYKSEKLKVAIHSRLRVYGLSFVLSVLFFNAFHSNESTLICAKCVTHTFTSFIPTVLFGVLHLQAVCTIPPLSVSLWRLSTTYLHHFFCLFIFYGHFPVFPPPHVASRVHCVWAPISGPPILWARWSCLLRETLRHGEGNEDWPDVGCCPVSHFSSPSLHTRIILIYKFTSCLS